MKITVRFAELKDRERIAEISRSAFRGSYYSPEIPQLVDENTIVVSESKKLLGLCHYWAGQDEGQIIRMAVDPEHQGRGLGRYLLLGALLHMQSRNVSVVNLNVNCNNTRAIALYRRFGFTEVGRRTRYYGAEGAISMSLKL